MALPEILLDGLVSRSSRLWIASSPMPEQHLCFKDGSIEGEEGVTETQDEDLEETVEDKRVVEEENAENWWLFEGVFEF